MSTILDSKAAAQLLGIAMPTLYSFTSKRQIPFYKPKNCRKIYFKREELEEWMLAQRYDTADETDTYVATDMAKRKGR